MSSHFNIEQLLKLAKTDPAALEALRQREIAALIDKAPPHARNRLRGLQFEIDCQRRLHKTPMGACVAISQMMMVSLAKLNAALHGEHPAVQPRPATVLPLDPHYKSLTPGTYGNA